LFIALLASACSDNPSPALDAQSSVDTGLLMPDSASLEADEGVAPEEDVAAQDSGSTEDVWAEVEGLIEEQRAEAKIPGLAVAVTRKGEVLWTRAYGQANVEDGTPVTVDTPFMLASVSKTVTAVAVMHAWEEAALSLDDEINSVLPFAVDNPRVEGEVILLRHLVSHTSGIRDNWGQMPYADGDSPHALGDYVEGYLVEGGAWYHATNNFFTYMPGTSKDYGNVATALAGFLVEVATETPFDDYCDVHIFDVLGMENTGWHLSDFDPAVVAMPYDYVNGAFEAQGHYGYADYPDGQLRSSISDMARFLAAVSNNGQLGDAQVLKPETVNEMFTAPVPSVDEGQRVFWYSSTTVGRAVLGHNGGDIGVATQMDFAPDTGIGVIILMNTSWTDSVGSAVEEIQSLLFERAESL
jgi:CubicO group peptidase (beta-lactamase class C family)